MKYIIEFEDEPSMYEAGFKHYQCKQVPYWSVSHGIIKNLTPYTEPDRKDIEDEVWRFAWEVLQLDLPVFREIFGYDTVKMDYRDFKYKYEAWMKSENEIHVGDEVVVHGLRVVVMKLDEKGNVDRYFTSDGKTFGNITGFLNNEVKKTGRHFPEVAELLEKMRGEEE